MKKITIFILVILYSYSQLPRCGTEIYYNSLKNKYPILEKLEKIANEKARKFRLEDKKTKQIIKIPVVVHIVYKNSSENLPDSQVYSQIEVLNEDFRKLNKDISKVPSVFSNIAADFEIEFCLANKDPNGNPTNGITRTPTNVQEFGLDDKVKQSSQGGKDPWPTNKYLNIWVCDLGGGLLGYATLPPNAQTNPDLDGVVINYRYFGRYGTAQTPYELGRTATHEIGHWLGLYHTFQGGCEGTSDIDCDQAGDHVCDTPPTAQPNYGCPSTQNTCIETPNDKIDMTMNYMDYPNDACMYMFTIGQKNRVYSMINQYRQWLLNPPQLCAQPPLIANFYTKTQLICEGSSITFYDKSEGNPQNWKWILPGANPDTAYAQNPTVTYDSAGTYNVTLIIYRGNESDTITLKNYLTVIKESELVGRKLPFSEDFETGSFTTNNWTIFNPDNSITWQIIPTLGTYPGSKAAYINLYNYNKKGEKDAMITPLIDMRNITSAYLSFEHSYALYSNQAIETDSLIIYIMDGCTGIDTPITIIGETGNGELATSKNTTQEFFPQTEKDWCKLSSISKGCYAIDLTPFSGKIIRIKFMSISNYENNLFIDNINIDGTYTNILYKNSLKLNVYPNPAKNKLFIETKTPVNIKLYSIHGKLILNKSINNNNIIDISQLPRGSYILKATDKYKNTFTKLIIKS